MRGFTRLIEAPGVGNVSKLHQQIFELFDEAARDSRGRGEREGGRKGTDGSDCVGRDGELQVA
jgi:hypothetical protein